MVLLLLPRAGGVKTSKVELRTGAGKERWPQSKALGAGGRAARPRRGGGWGSTGIMPLLALSPSLFWGLGAGSRGGVALLANAGDNQQKTNYPW